MAELALYVGAHDLVDSRKLRFTLTLCHLPDTARIASCFGRRSNEMASVRVDRPATERVPAAAGTRLRGPELLRPGRSYPDLPSYSASLS